MITQPGRALTRTDEATPLVRVNLRGLPAEVSRRVPATWRGAILSVGLVLLVMLAGCGSVTADEPASIGASGGATEGASIGTAPAYDVSVSSATIPSLRPEVPADPADVYVPQADGPFPVALLLQGAGVERSAYADYAEQVASYGFIVVVPDHKRELFGTELPYSEQSQVHDIAQWMATANTTAGTPLTGHIDTATLALMGHSFGGAAGLSAIEDTCRLPFCIMQEQDYPSRPAILKAGVFFGTNLASPMGDAIPAVNTAGIPVGFVQGTLDTATTPQETNDTIAQMSGGPVTLATIEGLDHFGLTTVRPDFGGAAATATPTPTELPQDEGITKAAHWTAVLLHAALGNAAAAQAVADEPSVDTDPAVTVTVKP